MSITWCRWRKWGPCWTAWRASPPARRGGSRPGKVLEDRIRGEDPAQPGPIPQAEQNSEVERALAVAMRTHRERQNLFRRMEVSARARNHVYSAARWDRAAKDAQRLAGLLEDTLAAMRKPVETE